MSHHPETKRGGDPIPPSRARPGTGPRLPDVAEARLWAISLRYLQRFSASVDMLRRVLDRRLRPAVAAGLLASEEAARRREMILQKAAGYGYLNDARFAEGRIAALLRQGKSPRVIAETLKAKGVAPATVTSALAHAAETAQEDIAAAAARAYAKRRRLGPYRSGPTDARQAEKDLAAMLRAGHALSLARQILSHTETDPPD